MMMIGELVLKSKNLSLSCCKKRDVFHNTSIAIAYQLISAKTLSMSYI